MLTLQQRCLRSSSWRFVHTPASTSSGWRFLFSAPREAEAATGSEPAQQPASQAAAQYAAEDTAAGNAAEGGARSAAARVKKGHDPLEHILVHDRKVSATRAAKLLRLKLNQEGAQRERYLKDVIWRVRTPGDARAALAVTELFTQHRAARLQLRTYKKYVSEKLIERALKAGAREVATQAIDRAGELELGVSKRMLKLTVQAASDARDLESIQKLHSAALRERSSHGYPFVRAYLDNKRPDLAKQAAEDFSAYGFNINSRIAARLREALGGNAPGDTAEPAASANAARASEETPGAASEVLGSGPELAGAAASAGQLVSEEPQGAVAEASEVEATEATAAAGSAVQASGEPEGAAGEPGALAAEPPAAASGKTEGPIAGSGGPDPPAAGAAAAAGHDAVSAAPSAAADIAAASLMSDPGAAAELAAAAAAATGDAPENVAAVEAAVTAEIEPMEPELAGKAPS